MIIAVINNPSNIERHNKNKIKTCSKDIIESLCWQIRTCWIIYISSRL